MWLCHGVLNVVCVDVSRWCINVVCFCDGLCCRVSAVVGCVLMCCFDVDAFNNSKLPCLLLE